MYALILYRTRDVARDIVLDVFVAFYSVRGSVYNNMVYVIWTYPPITEDNGNIIENNEMYGINVTS